PFVTVDGDHVDGLRPDDVGGPRRRRGTPLGARRHRRLGHPCGPAARCALPGALRARLRGPRRLTTPSAVALIPARSGSERVPGKNVRPLAGHPLLAYAVETALQS